MRSRFRLVRAGICVLALFAAGVGLLAFATHSSVAAPGDPLLPDLVTQPFDEAYIEGDPGEKLLRFSNTVGNRGVGTLEVLSKRADAALCPDSGDRPAFQRVYRDSAAAESAGFFNRSDDLEFRRRLAGCVEYHPAHLHWHFEDFARYSLSSVTDGEVVARATKVSFCIVDNGRRFPELPGTPQFQHYDFCEDPTAVTGLSIGWADTYGAGLAGQHLDVSGLPDGEYCLISKADPSDRLRELRNRNNSHRSRFYLDVGNSFVDPRREQPC